MVRAVEVFELHIKLFYVQRKDAIWRFERTIIMNAKSLESVSEIVTHNGVFHADEVFACALLKELVDCVVIRTRGYMTPGDRIIVDVGGVYNPEAGQYDHHQKDGKRVPRENGIVHSGFGLVWEAYGRAYIEKLYKLSKEAIEEVWEKVDQQLVSQVDAADNGIRLTETKPEYVGYGTTLSALISQLNPNWTSESNGDVEFASAMLLAKQLLEGQVRSVIGVVLSRELVKEAMNNRGHLNILTLNGFMPWQETVIEDENILYVIFQDRGGDWRVQAVPQKVGSFQCRKPFPKEWAGDVKAIGIDDAVFCHINLFLCGTKTKEAAELLARKALES